MSCKRGTTVAPNLQFPKPGHLQERRKQLTTFQGLLPENHGQNLFGFRASPFASLPPQADLPCLNPVWCQFPNTLNNTPKGMVDRYDGVFGAKGPCKVSSARGEGGESEDSKKDEIDD